MTDAHMNNLMHDIGEGTNVVTDALDSNEDYRHRGEGRGLIGSFALLVMSDEKANTLQQRFDMWRAGRRRQKQLRKLGAVILPKPVQRVQAPNPALTEHVGLYPFVQSAHTPDAFTPAHADMSTDELMAAAVAGARRSMADGNTDTVVMRRVESGDEDHTSQQSHGRHAEDRPTQQLEQVK